MSTDRPYHHGDLRRALLDSALDAVVEQGPPAVSLRDLARRAGVSHAAPAHHFGTKAGLLTALAIEGYERLAERLDRAWRDTGDFLEVGAAYVRFAVDCPGYFTVLSQPDLLVADDPQLLAARKAAGDVLRRGIEHKAAPPDPTDKLELSIAAWSLVHGLAVLLIAGSLPDSLGSDPELVTRRVARHLLAISL